MESVSFQIIHFLCNYMYSYCTCICIIEFCIPCAVLSGFVGLFFFLFKIIYALYSFAERFVYTSSLRGARLISNVGKPRRAVQVLPIFSRFVEVDMGQICNFSRWSPDRAQVTGKEIRRPIDLDEVTLAGLISGTGRK